MTDAVSTRPSITHSLKVEPQYFDALIEGRKTFEVRFNDREFQVGDVLAFLEYDKGRYTGAPVFKRTVSYILTDEFIGLTTGFVCMGLAP